MRLKFDVIKRDRFYNIFQLSLFVLIIIGCARSPLKNKSQLFRPVSETTLINKIEEKSDRNTLILSLEQQIKFLSNRADFSFGMMEFGHIQVSLYDYVKALEKLKQFVLRDNYSPKELREYINKNFEILQPYGNSNGWGQFKLTGYYEPIIRGSKVKTDKFSQPLYSKPIDLVKLNLNEFLTLHPEWLKNSKSEDLNFPVQTYARIEDIGDEKNIIPYYSREEIDGQLLLKDKNYELCYVDPIDAFFLQIQGSGKIIISKKESLSLTYGGQNGHKYYPIGKELLKEIPLNEMSKDRIEGYLRSLNENEMKSIMFKNPSYVFFQKTAGERGITFQGTEVIDLRTIATDSNLFPKGALAVLEVKKWKTEFEDTKKSDNQLDESTEGSSFVTFVFDQDTGGAIRGPGRVDYFIGSGDLAGQLAGQLNLDAEIYYLIPKSQ